MSLFLVINVMVGPRNRVKQQLLTFGAINFAPCFPGMEEEWPPIILFYKTQHILL